jgi:2-C-methyl-D-erythritol 4-phosphate cytidylyltransferase
MIKTAVIIVGAGSGVRFGGRKQSFLLGGRTVLEHSLKAFQSHREITKIYLVVKNPNIWEEGAADKKKIAAVVQGGIKRQDSVQAGLSRLFEGEDSDCDVVLVHDGVRPLVGTALISRMIKAAVLYGAACPALGLEDTIKRAREEHILFTEDRTELFRVQTPQAFSADVLRRAYEKAGEEGIFGTDDASLVERLDYPVRLVEGERRNIKITTPLDLKIAEALIDD